MKEIINIIHLIDEAISDDPDNWLYSGNIIKDWYNEDIDAARLCIDGSKKWLAEYQSNIISLSWISNLKIKYTNAAGYFIEVNKNAQSQVPDDFVHKQTLVNAVRFSTKELDEFAKNMYESESNIARLEYDCYCSVREEVLWSFENIKQISAQIAKIDFIWWLSSTAYKHNYIRPELTRNYDLDISSGRHPVIETIESDFISNWLCQNEEKFVHIITWPNMWWKSTFLRQNALIILLAHMGAFVPAKKALIPLTDRLFSRVWATDNLYLWQSTFMVEMQEVAYILHNSTRNSFVIIDEVWRWTSTYDWISLAWAILLYNHDKIQAKTLFATHYHELVDESKRLSHTKNFSVAVWENEENIIFLRKIVPGWIKKSYWHQVALLAGIPQEVIQSAKEMLHTLEHNWEKFSQFQLPLEQISQKSSNNQTEKKLVSSTFQKIQTLDIDWLSARDALQILYECKKLKD